MSKSKGDRRERQAVEIFESAGFYVETPNHVKFSNKDFFNKFDFMAVHPEFEVVFGQVKSNRPQGIRAFSSEVAELFSDEHTRLYYVVCYDGEGWRLIEINTETGDYTDVVDERDSDANMGVEMEEYLTDLVQD